MLVITKEKSVTLSPYNYLKMIKEVRSPFVSQPSCLCKFFLCRDISGNIYLDCKQLYSTHHRHKSKV